MTKEEKKTQKEQEFHDFIARDTTSRVLRNEYQIGHLALVKPDKPIKAKLQKQRAVICLVCTLAMGAFAGASIASVNKDFAKVAEPTKTAARPANTLAIAWFAIGGASLGLLMSYAGLRFAAFDGKRVIKYRSDEIVQILKNAKTRELTHDEMTRLFKLLQLDAGPNTVIIPHKDDTISKLIQVLEPGDNVALKNAQSANDLINKNLHEMRATHTR